MDIIQLPLDFDSPKLCECGCGQPTKLASITDKKCGAVRGQPLRYIVGHNRRGKKTDPITRFWSKVQKTDTCWLWLGAPHHGGYGRIHDGKKVVEAHRFSYEFFKGPIPEGMFVCHSCDVPACVNPNHLWVGTCFDNVQDCINKGRTNKARGEAGTRRAKLTENEVRQIRLLFKQIKSYR